MSTEHAPSDLIPAEILASTTPVAIYGVQRARQGCAEAFLKETLAVVGPTRSEAGCIQYVVHTTKDDPQAIVLYEHWASGADLAAHLSRPFMQTFFAAIPDLIEGNIEVRWLQPATP